jgi:hypothetical protein
MEHPHNHPQFVLGRHRLARAVQLLLTRNELSHQELDTFAGWCAPDEQAGQWLAKSQISTICNAKLPKPGGQIFLSLAWINKALAELSRGEPQGRPLPPKLRRLAVAPGPWFLAHPVTGEPCDVGDWFRIYCGELTTDELEDLPDLYSRETAVIASEKLALLAQAWMAEQRLSWRAGREETARECRDEPQAAARSNRLCRGPLRHGVVPRPAQRPRPRNRRGLAGGVWLVVAGESSSGGGASSGGC